MYDYMRPIKEEVLEWLRKPTWEVPVTGHPWICPKCGRVWGPYVVSCCPCNSKVEKEEKQHKK
jgi:uncharacterized OB-fold protein